ncbi:flavin reductase family protein [Pseudoflavonifractor sp. 524-17]|uniref:flavin reductase family protein n=1 Tax=Pseudoflavonifractor sp. 524-17 TaxID=2304577 RepID=UPI0013794AC5|nr:flavin reductase [Pseudoflavonifractor sp. 524-17]NCE63449.1 flavin reductase family protein [Pseudoflavonifractor sp. 524-17]
MFQAMDPKALDQNVFSMLADQWMLITAGTPEHCNTMTASWGGLGVLWNKNVAMCVVRPQRHTLTFLEAGDTYTLAFFGEEQRKNLTRCGKVSGREVDKVKECGFTVAAARNGAPYFEEAQLVLVCRKLYWQDLEGSHFLDKEIDKACYPERDYHRMFIGEIVEVLKKT